MNERLNRRSASGRRDQRIEPTETVRSLVAVLAQLVSPYLGGWVSGAVALVLVGRDDRAVRIPGQHAGSCRPGGRA